ncbi:hypothetical protein [Desulfogranum japonicum]|uniref:hypothetical protein n=1 Tax=Desulfogranum japonicum TaxID=231447 RepID=UPI000424ABD2|nr:hypothetical protein [Desulfogranum japonicum]
MKKLLLTIIVVLIAVFLSLGGCSLIESRVARWTTDFNVSASDSRILYENGAEKLAHEIAQHLNNAIQVVESEQYGTYKEPVIVYAFASPETFAKFSGVSGKARGASVGNEIYLSGLMLKLPDEVYGMLAHELSHVQLSQTMGVITFNRSLPRWFREGLAIYVSDGGGAPRNFEKETVTMFVEGKYFLPEETGSLLNRSLQSTVPIGPRMFYSQSGMFVNYLANTYPQEFIFLLKGLQQGAQFKSHFRKTFNYTVEDMLEAYIDKLKDA